MKHTFGGLIGALVIVGTLYACAAPGGDGVTPAEGTLLTCEKYPVALTKAAELNAAGKLGETEVKIVDGANGVLKPLCTGPAPDVDSKLRDVAIDGAMRALGAVAGMFF